MLGFTRNIFITLIRKADKLTKANEPEDALLLFGDALKKISEIEEPELFAHVKLHQGICYYLLANRTPEPAGTGPIPDDDIEEQIFLESLEMRFIETVPYGARQIQQCDAGELEKRTSWLDKSLTAFEEAGRIFTGESYKQEQGLLLFNTGNSRRLYGQLLRSEAYFNSANIAYIQAAEIFKKNSYPEKYVMIHNNIGETCHELARLRNGQYHRIRALMSFEQAAKTVNSAGNELLKDVTLSNLGRMMEEKERLIQSK